jgi:hypothetical protein
MGLSLTGRVKKPNKYIYLLQWNASHHSVWASSNWKGWKVFGFPLMGSVRRPAMI